MPLQIIIVGGGISGVTAAVALHQAGHKVQIYEKSKLATEIGLAMACTPNGALALQKLGFDFPKAKGVQLDNWETIDGNTLDQIRNVDVSQSEKIYGASFRAIHRNDLFQGLLALAEQSDTSTNAERRSIKLNLDAKVVHVDVEKGSVTFEDGSIQDADLIVAADGVHSCVRPFVVDPANDTSTETGLSAYRFLIPRTVIHQSPAALRILAKKLDGVGMYADTLYPDQERNLVWYACRGGDLYNFVCIHPKRKDANDIDLQSQLLQEYGHFHPDIVEILHLATDVRAWPLLARQPLVSWSKGKVVLIGDAAHPMLPFGGQGANQGIEDGATLGVFMRGIDETTLPARLKAYVQFRTRRVARTQLLASVRPGNESLVIERVKEFMEPGIQLPDIFPKRVQHDSSYDAVAEAERFVASLGLNEP